VSTDPLILCVCTYNQTRSVLMAALLTEHLRAEGVRANVASAGTRAGGGRPLSTTIDLLARRGIDVSDHRGAPLRDGDAGSADLIITAEQNHVVDIAVRWPQQFRHTFTLPELIDRIQQLGPRGDHTLGDWITRLNTNRTAGLDYLDDRSVAEVADPTGREKQAWATAFEQIDTLTRRLAIALR
jgi:protein-tyrosine-phosphatase